VSFTSGQTTTVPITIWDGLRTALPADLKPGQSVQLRATVTAPPNAGRFTLRFDLVEEGIV